MAVRQLDLGNTLIKALEIRGAQNALNQNELEAQRQQQFQKEAPLIASGDPYAAKRAMAIDPQATVRMINGINSMDDRQRKIASENLGLLARAAREADTPEEWDTLITTLEQHAPGGGFEKYRGAFGQRDMIIATLEGAASKVKAPTVQEFFDEKTGQPYKAQWNPETRTWDRIGGAKAPGGGGSSGGSGGLTTAQVRTNEEIDAARRALDNMGMSHEEVIRVAKSQRDTGRANPDYNPYINKLVSDATSRKYGDDPHFIDTYDRYLQPAAQPLDPNAPAGTDATAAPAAPSMPAPPDVRRSPHPPGPQPVPPAQPRPQPRDYSTMTIEQLNGIINGPAAATLTVEDLEMIDQRMKSLGY